MLHNSNLLATARDTMHKTILVVENDEALAGVLKLVISVEKPYRVLTVTDGFQALSLLRETTFDVLLLDYHLPQFCGLILYSLIRTIKGQEETPIIFLGDDILQDDRDEIARQQIPVINTPFELDDLFDVLEQTLTA